MNFVALDKKIYGRWLRLKPNDFIKIWTTPRDFFKHLKKRIKNKDIASPQEYFTKAYETFLHPPSNLYGPLPYLLRRRRLDRYLLQRGSSHHQLQEKTTAQSQKVPSCSLATPQNIAKKI